MPISRSALLTIIAAAISAYASWLVVHHATPIDRALPFIALVLGVVAAITSETILVAIPLLMAAEIAIADERMRMSELAFGRTRNRSLLGTLNDFAFMAQSADARRTEPETPEELIRFLAQTPILPLDGASPIELTRAAFGRQSVP